MDSVVICRLVVQANAGTAFGQRFLLPTADAPYVPLTFVLLLEPPVPMPLAVAASLHDIGVESAASEAGAASGPRPTLQGPPKAGKTASTRLGSGHVVIVKGEAHAQRYSMAPTNGPTCIVHRVPFTHASRLRPLVALLRQQLAFNALFASCYSGAEPVPSANAADAVLSTDVARLPPLVVEVSAAPPGRITLTVAHPLLASVLAALELVISHGGTVDVTVGPASVATHLGPTAVAQLQKVRGPLVASPGTETAWN